MPARPHLLTEVLSSGECGKYKSVQAIFWPWHSGQSHQTGVKFLFFYSEAGRDQAREAARSGKGTRALLAYPEATWSLNPYPYLVGPPHSCRPEQIEGDSKVVRTLALAWLLAYKGTLRLRKQISLEPP